MRRPASALNVCKQRGSISVLRDDIAWTAIRAHPIDYLRSIWTYIKFFFFLHQKHIRKLFQACHVWDCRQQFVARFSFLKDWTITVSPLISCEWYVYIIIIKVYNIKGQSRRSTLTFGIPKPQWEKHLTNGVDERFQTNLTISSLTS